MIWQNENVLPKAFKESELLWMRMLCFIGGLQWFKRGWKTPDCFPIPSPRDPLVTRHIQTPAFTTVLEISVISVEITNIFKFEKGEKNNTGTILREGNIKLLFWIPKWELQQLPCVQLIKNQHFCTEPGLYGWPETCRGHTCICKPSWNSCPLNSHVFYVSLPPPW